MKTTATDLKKIKIALQKKGVIINENNEIDFQSYLENFHIPALEYGLKQTAKSLREQEGSSRQDTIEALHVSLVANNCIDPWVTDEDIQTKGIANLVKNSPNSLDLLKNSVKTIESAFPDASTEDVDEVIRYMQEF